MTWKEALDEYYQSHPTLTDDNRAWLRKNVLLDAPRIDELERKQVLALFGTTNAKGKFEFNNTLFVRTVLWQTLGHILASHFLSGNPRILWPTTHPLPRTDLRPLSNYRS